MDRTALVTGADRGLGLAVCAGLLERGWIVFAGQFLPEWPDLAALQAKHPDKLRLIPLNVGDAESVQAAARAVGQMTDHIDMIVNNAGISRVRPGEWLADRDYEGMKQVYNINSLGAIRVVEAFLPLTANGLKRLCFVSSEAGSIALSHRKEGLGYGMSKAALNMAVRIMFNDLHPDGYTFRLYHPGWMRSYMSGAKGVMGDMEPEESAAVAVPFFTEPRDDEDRLVMTDYRGGEWPF